MASVNNTNVFSIDDFDSSCNMCIEASAGTGKTYTVQQIVAELLRLAPARSLENILIVTYTEKAAGELRDRIRAKIQEVIDKNQYNTSGAKKYLTVEQQKENFKKQLTLVDNAPIFTIHSFCKQTLSEYGFNAKQCDNLELVDESEIKNFIDKWIRDELPQYEYYRKLVMLSGKTINKEEYGKISGFLYLNIEGNEVPEIITLDKTTVPNDYKQADRFTEDELLEYKTLTAMVNRKLRFNVLKLNYICNFAEKIRDVNSSVPVTNARAVDECETYRANLENLRNQIMVEENRRHSNAKEESIKNCNDLIKLYDAAKNSGIVVLGEDEVKKFPSDATKYFGTNGQNALCDYFQELKKKIEEVHKFGDAHEKLLKKIVFENKITELYKSWNENKATNKLQSFDDMIRNVREAVVLDDSELKQKLKDKYQYAIIDEFQDTNQKQWDIFSRVFMEDDNHSICVVGDPKQSIYKFQGADINVYTKAISCIKSGNSAFKVKPGKSFILDRNYRSTNKMIDFCNALFKPNNSSDFFGPGDIVFTESGYPSVPAQVKPNAEYCGNEIQPVWIPELQTDDGVVTEEGFAEFAVEQIINCCTYNDDGKTNLQVYKKNFKINNALALTNVGFGDFAVLCKSKSEMEPLKKAFAMAGIPYNHYKEANLFNGQECRDWIALFQAIDAEDFSSYNRKILNECLFSKFFGKSINEIQGNEFDRPDCPERQLIIKWQSLAKERKWALLQENIFESSKVEERLSSLDKLSSLSKLRQIGDYCVNYLYKNACTIEELLNHLALLSSEKDDSDEEDGNIVEKGTDFNAVQIMTIHASKGLEFPVVICPAGMKGKSNATDGMYHDLNNNLHISYDKSCPVTLADGTIKTVSEVEGAEDMEEWRRKFYVAYTRASSLMIMPWTAKKEFDFLLKAYKDSDAKAPAFLRKIDYPANFTWNDIRKQVKAIIEKQVIKSDLQDNSGEAEQKAQLKKLSGEIKKLNTYKLSYSNLSHGKKVDEYDAKVTSGHNEDLGDDNSIFDTKIVRVPCNYEPENLTVIHEKYPKGNLLGEAVHQTLEETDYKRIGGMSAEAIAEDSAYIYMMRSKFRGQGFNAGDESFKENELQTCKMIWNTMNAVLPEIHGNCNTGRSFSLKELESNQHFAELEFNMNPDIAQNNEGMRDYFNGFIDVLFTRTLENGQKIYSVLDWKTNSLEPAGYADAEALNAITNKEFSIQRVLYSYCLIKWLKQFNEEKSEEQIFNEQFGGIYYVYVRGCKAGNGNGIYAQTWESWSDLENAFKNIVEVKISKGKK